MQRRFGAGLTARTVGVTSVIAVVVVGLTLLTARTVGSLHTLVEDMASAEMENLMTSVRLVQQTESLISLGMMLAAAENHTERRTAMVELTDRTTWINKLTKNLLKQDDSRVLVSRVENTQSQLVTNIDLLNRLIRKRIDGEAAPEDMRLIRTLADVNRELAGRLSVLMGYYSASMRSQMVERSNQLNDEIEEHQRNLILLTAVLLLTALATGFTFEMTVVRRIRRIQSAVDADNVEPEQVEQKGQDEIAQLSRTLAGYIRRIREQESKMQRINGELAFLAEHDPLTGLANRRHFYAAADRLIRNSSTPLCVALGDIDHFKEINDRYGHAVGDRVLAEAATRLKSGLRESDILARVGGEEFAAILPMRSRDDCLHLFDQIRQSVAAYRFEPKPGHTLTMTISFGVTFLEDTSAATSEEEAENGLLSQALGAADQALYRAKHLGRNRVVCDQLEPYSYDRTGLTNANDDAEE
ncbi:MAG: hypothetical protein CMI01_09750 [Oceanospirillaceae bacterium]|jgi:diguanylate cyclase (GGDEF)-like protein|nr:hypothetical protein [Oceanospirillaceae bacterium]